MKIEDIFSSLILTQFSLFVSSKGTKIIKYLAFEHNLNIHIYKYIFMDTSNNLAENLGMRYLVLTVMRPKMLKNLKLLPIC